MSLIESANLGFGEDDFIEVFERLWKKVIFEYKQTEKNIAMINSGAWGLMEKMYIARDFRGMKTETSMTFKGNLVWEMHRRGNLGERYLNEYDFVKAKKSVNFLKQIPAHLRLRDLYSQQDSEGMPGSTEVRLPEFKELLYVITNRRGEAGDFSSDEGILIELSDSKSETLWTGGRVGGIVLP